MQAIRDRASPHTATSSAEQGHGRTINGRISDIVNQPHFGSAAELESTLRNYVKIDNYNIPQPALKHRTPTQALKQWRAERPELFTKPVYNQAGLDRYRSRYRHVGTGLQSATDILDVTGRQRRRITASQDRTTTVLQRRRDHRNVGTRTMPGRHPSTGVVEGAAVSLTLPAAASWPRLANEASA